MDDTLRIIGRNRRSGSQRSGDDHMDRTIGPTVVWVDSKYGHDDSDHGSMQHPFATIGRAYELVPHIVAHDFQIRVIGGKDRLYTSFPDCIDPVIEEGGMFSIVGLGNAICVDGPFDCTTVTVKPGTTIGNYSSTRLLISTAPATFVAGQFDGYFVRITDDTDAAAIGKVFPIVQTNTDGLEIRLETTHPPNDLCEFEIIEPAVTIEAERVVLTVDDEGSQEPRFEFCNLKFHMYEGRTTDPFLEIAGNGRTAGARFAFVMFYADQNPI
jgi:hypothetical protein